PPRGDARRMNRAADHFFHPLVERLAPNLPLRLPALRLHARSPAVRGSMPRWQGCYTRSISSGTEGTPQLLGVISIRRASAARLGQDNGVDFPGQQEFSGDRWPTVPHYQLLPA